MIDYLQVGAITSPHGVHGEAKVYPMTDDVKRFKKLKEVYLGDDKRLLHISSVKFFKNMVILKFDEFTTPEEIDKIRKVGLYVTRDMAVKLQKDEYFIADLIGLEVYSDEDKLIGELTDVMQTGANDVYVVKTQSGNEILIPAIKDCILEVSIEESRMLVHLLPGLIDEE
ncbi:MAG: 16S rRNA processing protein RimM [Lachnospiraceae bacterium]|nr:16S rRNA processing protein RimM [Lachnospiraceae bacterium]